MSAPSIARRRGACGSSCGCARAVRHRHVRAGAMTRIAAALLDSAMAQPLLDLLGKSHRRRAMATFRRTLSAGSLTGDPIYNTAGEKLGKVEELMIDVVTGRVAYAVLSFGAVLGVGGKLFAI